MSYSSFDFASLPGEFSLRLVLIRHGEPEQEAKGKCYGKLEVGLSDAGRIQIQAMVSSLRNLCADALYASPLKRAIESAAIIGTHLGLKAIVSPELREIDFGVFEGLTFAEVEKRYPEEYKMWMERPTEIKFPRGESFAEVKTRVLQCKDFLLKAHAGKTVVVVAHGGANRIILAEALGMPDPMIFRIDQGYGAINVIDYLDSSSIVRLVNG